MLPNYDINWYGSLMFLDSGNLTFVFSKGSNSVADCDFVNQGKYMYSECMFDESVRITQCVCSKGSNHTFSVWVSVFKGK